MIKLVTKCGRKEDCTCIYIYLLYVTCIYIYLFYVTWMYIYIIYYLYRYICYLDLYLAFVSTYCEDIRPRGANLTSKGC